MKNTLATLTVVLVVTIMSSCSKKEEITCTAGGGGYLQIKVIPEKDGTAVTSTAGNPVKVFIAFDQPSFPGEAENLYSKKVTAKNDQTFIDCNNLKCGIYYFYVKQVDEATGDIFTGGKQVVTDQPEGTLEVKIALTKQ